MSEFGIYVHWPYCSAKCPYCDFNSHVRAERDDGAWARAIARELAFVAEELSPADAQVTSVFFGGGTPSLMAGRATGAVLDAIARHWRVAEDAEITLESNPASADAMRFRDYRSAGVNRLSLGVQSLDDRALGFLGRRHSAAEARAGASLAADVFDQVSFDLIYSRPGQTVPAWQSELREALALGAGHLSLYQLTIEEATPFAALERAGTLVQNDEERAADLFDATQETMDAAGMPAYEISNHARPGLECRHNLLYWRYGNFVGVGPGAHGRIANGNTPVATLCERLPERWLAQVDRSGHGFVSRAHVASEEAAREHLLMNMRLVEGLDLAAYRARWNIAFDDAVVADLVANGWIARNGPRIAATHKGRLILNRITSILADAGAPPTNRASGMSSARD